jgi:hypothetical protein
VTLVAGVWLVAVPGIAAAHAELRESSPGADTTVGGQVDEIQLAFWARLLPGSPASILVFAPDGSPVPANGPVRTAPTVLAQPIEPLTLAGTYQIRYTITAEDGAEQQGAFVFAYDPEAPRPIDVVGAELLPGRAGDGVPIGTVVAFAGMAIFAAAVLWLAFGRRGTRSTPPGRTPVQAGRPATAAESGAMAQPAGDEGRGANPESGENDGAAQR